jgi:peptidoglycan/LPS O-acetylase OafA/YrhL
MSSTSEIRYPMLDALRGIAAVGVLLFHIGPALNMPVLAPHGYLAVDFFFILSGFVVSHAYTERVQHLGLPRFFRLRARRLMPLCILGVILGTIPLLVTWHLAPHASDGLFQTLAAAGLNCFLIPKLWTGKATGHEMFPANSVLWSLLLELLVNIVWAAWFVRRKSRTLAITAGAGWLVLTAYAWHTGNAGVGWKWSTFPGGLGRVAFGFFAGVLLCRFRSRTRRSPVLSWLAGAALILIMCLPACPWWIEVLLILFILPGLVYFGAVIATGDEPRFYSLLGDTSYPLYAIHMPLLAAVSTYMTWRHPGQDLGFRGYLLCIPIFALSYIAGRFYDLPVRRWLSNAARHSRGTLSAAGSTK